MGNDCRVDHVITRGGISPLGLAGWSRLSLLHDADLNLLYFNSVIIWWNNAPHRITQALQNRTSELVAARKSTDVLRKRAHRDYRTTPDGRILEANQRSAEILGLGMLTSKSSYNIKALPERQ